ncbi:MAG TPA: hypothetical protein VGJ41_11885 [Nocardioides sp.]|jgi:hypothetical protein
MDTVVVVILIVIVAVIVAAAAVLVYRRRQSDRLKERFGPEYARAVEDSGDRRSAERELAQREKRRESFETRPLSSEIAQRYRDEWDALQQRFVDDPSGSVTEADRFVVRVMRERGYPVDEFDRRAGDISVDHPEVATYYRQAHDVAVAQTRGETDTEQLRRAVTAYRRLVDVLLEDHADAGNHHPTGPAEAKEQP